MNAKLIQKIEWHFYNHEIDLKHLKELEEDIIYSNMTVQYASIGNKRHQRISPAEIKHEKLVALYEKKDWAAVIRNTFTSFKYLKPYIYDVMVDKYLNKKKYDELICDCLSELTYLRWRKEWLECACKIASEYGLIEK